VVILYGEERGVDVCGGDGEDACGYPKERQEAEMSSGERGGGDHDPRASDQHPEGEWQVRVSSRDDPGGERCRHRDQRGSPDVSAGSSGISHLGFRIR